MLNKYLFDFSGYLVRNVGSNGSSLDKNAPLIVACRFETNHAHLDFSNLCRYAFLVTVVTENILRYQHVSDYLLMIHLVWSIC